MAAAVEHKFPHSQYLGSLQNYINFKKSSGIDPNLNLDFNEFLMFADVSDDFMRGDDKFVILILNPWKVKDAGNTLEVVPARQPELVVRKSAEPAPRNNGAAIKGMKYFNEKTLSGKSVSEISAEKLIVLDNYAFDVDELVKLANEELHNFYNNPYTKTMPAVRKEFSATARKKINEHPLLATYAKLLNPEEEDIQKQVPKVEEKQAEVKAKPVDAVPREQPMQPAKNEAIVYKNSVTFFYDIPVAEIKVENLLVLDGYAFDFNHLIDRANADLSHFYINPHLSTPGKLVEFSDSAKAGLKSHSILGQMVALADVFRPKQNQQIANEKPQKQQQEVKREHIEPQKPVVGDQPAKKELLEVKDGYTNTKTFFFETPVENINKDDLLVLDNYAFSIDELISRAVANMSDFYINPHLPGVEFSAKAKLIIKNHILLSEFARNIKDQIKPAAQEVEKEKNKEVKRDNLAPAPVEAAVVKPVIAEPIYINKATFLYADPIQKIKAENLFVLDKYAFDVEELASWVEIDKSRFYKNPHTNLDFSEAAKELLRKHPVLKELAPDKDKLQNKPVEQQPKIVAPKVDNAQANAQANANARQPEHKEVVHEEKKHYLNTVTFMGTPVKDISPADLIVLDQYAFNVIELLQFATDRGSFKYNPEIQDRRGKFTGPARQILAEHPLFAEIEQHHDHHHHHHAHHHALDAQEDNNDNDQANNIIPGGGGDDRRPVEIRLPVDLLQGLRHQRNGIGRIDNARQLQEFFMAALAAGGDHLGQVLPEVDEEEVDDDKVEAKKSYENKVTFLYQKPIAEIEKEKLVILDNYAFDVDELKEYAEIDVQNLTVNPHINDLKNHSRPFSLHARRILARHPILGKYIAEKNEIENRVEMDEKTVLNIKSMVKELVAVGFEKSEDAVAKLYEQLTLLHEKDRKILYDYTIQVPIAGGDTYSRVKFSDLMGGDSDGQPCIIRVKVYLWQLVIDYFPLAILEEPKVHQHVVRLASSKGLALRTNPIAYIMMLQKEIDTLYSEFKKTYHYTNMQHLDLFFNLTMKLNQEIINRVKTGTKVYFNKMTQDILKESVAAIMQDSDEKSDMTDTLGHALNKVTFFARKPVSEIPSDRLLMLDGYAFDVSELARVAEEDINKLYINPYIESKIVGDEKAIRSPNAPVFEFTENVKQQFADIPELVKYVVLYKNTRAAQLKACLEKTAIDLYVKFSTVSPATAVFLDKEDVQQFGDYQIQLRKTDGSVSYAKLNDLTAANTCYSQHRAMYMLQFLFDLGLNKSQINKALNSGKALGLEVDKVLSSAHLNHGVMFNNPQAEGGADQSYILIKMLRIIQNSQQSKEIKKSEVVSSYLKWLDELITIQMTQTMSSNSIYHTLTKINNLASTFGEMLTQPEPKAKPKLAVVGAEQRLFAAPKKAELPEPKKEDPKKDPKKDDDGNDKKPVNASPAALNL